MLGLIAPEVELSALSICLAREVDKFCERPADVDGDVADGSFVVRETDVFGFGGGAAGGVGARGRARVIVDYKRAFAIYLREC